MRQADGNPSSNQLNAGVTEEALMEAVKRSGYPMQAAVVTAVADGLKGWGSPDSHTWTAVQEEWTYVDSEAGKTRALDALVESHLWEGFTSSQPRVRPVLSLLIECKQSELPFIFFTREASQLPDYPVTSGFPHDDLTLRTDDDPSSWVYPLTSLWGLRHQDFIVQPRVAVSVSAARRHGKGLEVSGDDTYNSLVLPLLKATEHLRRVTKFANSHYTDGRLIVSLVVMRAPMVAVAEDGSGGAEHVPWVRVHRYEPEANPRSWQSHRLAAFDIVHEDYLPTYLATLRSYVEHFASNSMECIDALLSGRGFARGLGGGAEPIQLEPRRREDEPQPHAQAVAKPVTVRSTLARGRRKVGAYGSRLRQRLRAQSGRREEEGRADR